MTPEQKSRQEIDRQLEQCGWVVQGFRDMNITAGLGVAVREFPLKSGHADYLLYADCKALGVIEAKPEGHNLTGVETQSGKYMDGLPDGLPHFRLPLPFAYESTGTVTHFTNALEPDARSREVFTFHRPDELIRLVMLDHQMRALLSQMPPLNTLRLWRIQVDSQTPRRSCELSRISSTALGQQTFGGKILIYASRTRYSAKDEADLMREYGIKDASCDDLPRGVLIGTVELYDCDGGKWHLRKPCGNQSDPRNYSSQRSSRRRSGFIRFDTTTVLSTRDGAGVSGCCTRIGARCHRS